MSFDLSDVFITRELRRADQLAKGLPKAPGVDKSEKISETLRFPDYHEPLDRWPFIADPLLAKIRKYGSRAPLLTDNARTKGVPNQRQIFQAGPSDRIASNLTPSARHLRLKAFREERVRNARIRRLVKEEAEAQLALAKTPKAVAKKKAAYAKYGKLVSRSPKRPREPMPGVYRKRVDLDNYQMPGSMSSEEKTRSDSDSDLDFLEDSVKLGMKDKRKSTGQEIADMKLRTRLFGTPKIDKKDAEKPFLDRFPYKSCQRGQSANRRVGGAADALLSLDPPEEVKDRKTRRRSAIVPDEKTVAQITQVTTRNTIRIRRQLFARKSGPPVRCFGEASQPNSPNRQMNWIRANRPNVELNPDDAKKYYDYLMGNQGNVLLKGIPRDAVARIRTKLNQKWLTDIMLKRKVAQIGDELFENHLIAERKSIIDYVLLDPAENLRTGVMQVPPRYKSSIVRAPVPWRQTLLVAKQYCRHNLFTTNPIILRIRMTWERRYRKLRFVDTQNLRGRMDNPLSPEEMQEKVMEQCKGAKDMLLNRWMSELAVLFVTLVDQWRSLVPIKRSESLGQIKRFYNCVRAIMSINLRSMAISSLEDFLAFMKTYTKGNDYEGDQYRDGEYLITPMLKIKLLEKDGCVEFYPPLEDTKKAIMECLKAIVESTHKFPRIERELFPELRGAKMYLLPVSWQEDYIQDMVRQAEEIFDRNVVGPKKYINLYNKYAELLNGQAEKDKEEFLKGEATLQDFRARMDGYARLKNEIGCIRNFALLNMFELDCTDLNKEMANRCANLRQSLIRWQVDMNRKWNREICNQFDEMATRLGEIPDKTKDLVDLQRYLKVSMNETMPILNQKISIATQRVLFLLDCTLFPTEDIQLNTRVFQWPKDMASVFELAKTRTGHKRDQVEEDLRKQVDEFEDKLKVTSRELETFMKKDPPVLTMDEMRSNVQIIDRLDARAKEAVEKLREINQEEVYLDWDPSNYPLLTRIGQSVERFSTLWHLALDFHENYEKWYFGPFKGLDTTVIQKQVESMYSTACHLSKTFNDYPAARRISETVRAKIEKFRTHLPVLHTLCNPGLRKRHWDAIGEANGMPVKYDDSTSLHDMIEAGLNRIVEQLEEIGSAASKEFALETAMDKMKQEWSSVCFECVPYRESGVSILSGIEDVQQMLDDHILKAQTMHSSAYIKPFEEEMKAWEDKLISMQDILDAWLRCQESWLYLEPIFNSEDIMKQMPVEGRKFNKVDRIWRNIMAKTVADPRVLHATNQPNMLQNLQEANELLDEIMKGLNDYLEKKRLFFPRFFFLSNDELLEILSETKDPLRVQPHIKKCFDGIDHLSFKEDKFGNQDVVGMISTLGELVEFSNMIYPADAKGMVEKWLLQVEKQMFRSLKDIIAKAVPDYFKQDLGKWIIEWPGQAILASRTINWTAETAKAIENNTLPQLRDQQYKQLDQIVQMVKNGLSPAVRTTVIALIVLDVHSRDILDKLVSKGVTSLHDFEWVSVMRYYLTKSADDPNEPTVNIEMISTLIEYGFEYMGNTGRLVVTPLTDRCFRTLMGALKMNLGGAPEGPAGSGKTETCKDLAKAVAKQCIVFNCCDGVDYHAMAKFLKGLAQSGSWCCFDEFNRIELDVLSVVAQQISTIQEAKAGKVKTFMFEGAELLLNPNCSIFITMNPESKLHKLRHQLPDNLKLLFRPVAMMLPDKALIAEVVLYSMGFNEARTLARKIVETFNMCAEQLSNQHHYDYSMRAVKSVLNAAAKIKISHADHEDENEIILKALVDVNLPQFVGDDVSLFKGVVSDVFPKLKLPTLDRPILKEGLEEACKRNKLEPIPWFINKMMELYEMLQVQHGIMIIGRPMSCKSKLYQILSEGLTKLADENKHDKLTTYHKAYCKVVNPKSMTLHQLYGLFDPYTHEWTDGVLGSTFREMATASTEERKWIVLDGPVDPTWIENMNTALDDSKKLCLMNGEIIHLSPWMNIFFETDVLDKASPATVGRCGMVYMDDNALGWRPLKQSFLNELPRVSINDEQVENLDEMFEWLVPSCLGQIKTYELFVPLSELHLFQSMIKLFRAVLQVDNLIENQNAENPVQVDTIQLQMTFLFCILWGLCSTIREVSRKPFDAHFRNLVDGLIKGHAKPPGFKLGRANMIPDGLTVFDYCIDSTKAGGWIRWVDQVAHDQKAGAVGASNGDDDEALIIPTAETTKQNFFLSLAMTHGFALGLSGPSGTGKSFLTNTFIRKLSKEKFITNVINFSARTSTNYTQDVIMSKLDRRRKGVFGPAMGKKCIVFVDDLNLPQQDSSGSIPPVELLRQWIDHAHWYDRKDTSKIELLDVHLLTALSPPGCGRNDISTRFIRHMNILGLDSFDDETLRRIFTTETDWHFKPTLKVAQSQTGHFAAMSGPAANSADDYDQAISVMGQPLVEATLLLYKDVQKSFLPTPLKCHYMFNLRDFAKVIQGIKQIPNTHLRDPNKLVRLWCHEVYRVFYDRMVDDDDRRSFFSIVKSNCQNHFKVDLTKILFPHVLGGASTVSDEHLRTICFGDYMHPEAEKKIYDEIPDITLLTKAMEHYLKEYNTVSKAPMPLVMFRYATEHTSRINRIIKQRGGHALLVGVGGSGRQSLAKLATFIANYELFQIEVNKTYGIQSWRNDLKKVLKMAGADCKNVVFLFTDLQIKDEAFLEDISMVLNTGEVPNLFATDEKTEILERVQQTCQATGREIAGEGTFANLYGIFLQNIKKNLHIILCMSPIGNGFRRRLRMFPSLVNCCTIDWFTEWPEDALEKVATKFLEDMDMEDEIRRNCVKMCGYFHESVRQTSIRYLKEMKRHNYVTPTSYLALILTFKSLLTGKRDEILNLKTRYEMGLGKLEYASSQVTAMQNELTALRPQLLETSDETERLMIKIEQDTIQVEAKKEIVACDEALANEAAAAAQAIRDDCENDLAEAIPALQSAVTSLDTLNAADVTVVKTMKNPAPIVKFVVEAVCVMKGVNPERKPDPDNKGKLQDDYWGPGQKMMGDIKFLDTLRAYDKDNIPKNIMKIIREKYVNNPYFDPNLVKKVSTACEGLCKWVRAIEVYDRVIKIVSPKKAKLAEAETELARQMDKLNEKRTQLQQVTDKLQALNDEFAAMTKKKKDLEDNIELCSQKLDRAEKLIYGLGGERDRWSEMAVNLGSRLVNITGDVLLASGVVAYLGAFNYNFRKDIISDWIATCNQNKIQCSSDFTINKTLGDPVQIRQWQIAGLPKDPFSVDNGVIVVNGRRWPLMIDPQGQASKWVKNMEKENSLYCIKYTDPDYMTVLQNAIQEGRPALLEGVGEELDPGLEPILLRQTFTNNSGTECIMLGDAIIEYVNTFKLYIVTDIRNPHFPPEVAVKVTVLNFMITPEGLQDQLLGILAAEEKPELEEMKNKLIVESANNKKQLKDIEDKILKVLSSSQGNILEDETAIQILSSSKVLSEEIAKKQKVSTETEKEIDETRNGYRPVAIHASIIFFCINELHNLDPMYQFSLPWFIEMYHRSIKGCEKREKVEERIFDLNKHFTSSIYKSISRSLFQDHVLVFSFILCVGLLRNEDKIDEDVWNFLLTGGHSNGSTTQQHRQPNPAEEWISEKAWTEIVWASRLLRALQLLMDHFRENIKDWKRFYDSANPQDEPLPKGLEKLDELERLVILRIVRPDKMIFAVRAFVAKHMGPEFIHVPSFQMSACFEDSDKIKPLILILYPGCDPLASVFSFIPEQEDLRPASIKVLSLGQGQGQAAEAAIMEAAGNGSWIILQNCHLAEKWMERLVKVWEDQLQGEEESIHPAFRMWLTSYATPNFPSQLLQTGVKIAIEPPQGLRANLLVAYQSKPIIEDDFYNQTVKQTEFHRLIYGLCFFHGVVLERHRYGPVGWNDKYAFNMSDLNISLQQLKEVIAKCEDGDIDEATLEAIQYLIAECNYGGRITDTYDRRLLVTLIQRLVNVQSATRENYDLAESKGLYPVPSALGRDDLVQDVTMTMRIVPWPQGMGLSDNSAMVRDQRDSKALLRGVLSTQPGIADEIEVVGPEGKDATKMMLQRVRKLRERVPATFNFDEVDANFQVSYKESLNNVLRLEITRYNLLLGCIHQTLEQLEKALKGEVVMSLELESAYESLLFRNELPASWTAFAFRSESNLRDFLKDLAKRVEFFASWVQNSQNIKFWLKAFYVPQAFLTAIQLNYARSYDGINVRQVGFRIHILSPTKYGSQDRKGSQEKTKEEETMQGSKPGSSIIYGLFIEGARWDSESNRLVEARPKIFHEPLPPILLEPILSESSQASAYDCPHHYACPVYRTQLRAGEIMPTGHSTNYIFTLDLPSDLPPEHWTRRGVAAILELCDM